MSIKWIWAESFGLSALGFGAERLIVVERLIIVPICDLLQLRLRFISR